MQADGYALSHEAVFIEKSHGGLHSHVRVGMNGSSSSSALT